MLADVGVVEKSRRCPEDIDRPLLRPPLFSYAAATYIAYKRRDGAPKEKIDVAASATNSRDYESPMLQTK
jgi:hypothetical protein